MNRLKKENNLDHKIRVRDAKLYTEVLNPIETGKGITIELTNSNNKVVVTGISTYEMHFRIIDPSNEAFKRRDQ